METKVRSKVQWSLVIALGLPLLLLGLFYLLRSNQQIMNRWTFGVVGPLEQWLGRLWSVVPFSAMEWMIAAFVAWNVIWLIRAVVLVLAHRDWGTLLRRVLTLAATWLWLLCSVCWLWNGAYDAATFSQRSGLIAAPYSVDELIQVTEYFAQQAAGLSNQVARDETGSFLRDTDAFFEGGPKIYQNIMQEFPILEMESVKAKPLVFSRLQSILGFTGMYFPFTGEANVNIDSPACLIPATIAHEMAHQRMVTSELEANFIGIAACVTCDDSTFQYSGYLLGLIQLCNALYAVDDQAWQAIVQQCFTPELAADWNENNAYWAALESPVEEVAGQAYDSYLKSNGQELGMRSYGACVDLLVSYFGTDPGNGQV